LLKDKVVAADSSKFRKGDFLNLLGVAVEIRNYSAFREQYFEVLHTFFEKYNIDSDWPVLKSEDIMRLVPTYDLHEAHVDLVEKLLKIEHINRIQISNTIIKVAVPTWKGEMSGIDFVDKILNQYYSIVPIWRYYVRQENPVEHAITDGIQGKITKLWKFVGKKANTVTIVPHGDQTYPCISICDLICGYIKREVYPIKAKGIYEQLKNKTSAYIDSEFIGDRYIDHLTPEFPYSLRVEQHLPHPLILIKGTDIESEIVKGTDFFKKLLRYVEPLGGAVTFVDLINHHRALQSGDLVVCLDENGYKEMLLIEILNPVRKIKVLNIKDTYELLKEKAAQATLNEINKK